MQDKLLPCPFCGANWEGWQRGLTGAPKLEELSDFFGGGWRVTCYTCCYSIYQGRNPRGPLNTPEEAIAAWNDRTPLPGQQGASPSPLCARCNGTPDGLPTGIDPRQLCDPCRADATGQGEGASAEDVERVAQKLAAAHDRTLPKDERGALVAYRAGVGMTIKYWTAMARAAIVAFTNGDAK